MLIVPAHYHPVVNPQGLMGVWMNGRGRHTKGAGLRKYYLGHKMELLGQKKGL